MLDATSRSQSFKNLILFIWRLRWDKHGNRLTNRFSLRVPVNLLRAWVPTYDNSVQSSRNNRIIRGFDNCSMSEPRFFRLLFLSNILHHGQYQRRWVILQQRETQATPQQRAVSSKITLL